MESSMIVKGSINYSPCGRKRKTTRTKKKPSYNRELKTNTQLSERVAKMKEQKEKYPSLNSTEYVPSPDTEYKNEVSKRYTVAIAYNKGGYQVISKDNIKDIGK